MADEMDYEKRLQIDSKVDRIFSKLSEEDSDAWRSAKRNSDRIEIVYRNADLFHREMTVTNEKNMKNKQVWTRAHKSDSEAEELRRQGNEHFAKGRYPKAIESYNAAIVRAPIDDDMMRSCRGCSASQLSAEDLAKNDQVRLPEDDSSKDDKAHENGSKEGSSNPEIGSQEGSSNSKNGSQEGCSNSKNGSLEGSSNSKNGSQEGCSNSKNGSQESNSNSKNGSKELTLALANRSAALFHLKRYEEAIRDIDCSLKFGYPRESRYKLYERRARAWLQLGRRQEANRDANDACKYLRETMPDGPVRQKHLDSLEALRNKCREAEGTREMEERHEVGEKRKVGEMDQKEKQQKGPEHDWTMKNQKEERSGNERVSKKADDGSKSLKERGESAHMSKEAKTDRTSENQSKVNTCTKCKQVGDGYCCRNQTNGVQDFRSFFSSLDGRPRSELVANRVPPEPEIESFCAGLEVCRSELCGRYTVSKQNFRVGNVIACMKPFAAVLYSDCHPSHCYHCFREVFLPFPCFACSEVVYCDDRCSLAAWNAYHWAECGWMGWMTFDLVGRLGHLAYRVLVAAGLENVLKVFMGISTKDQKKIGSVESHRNLETCIRCNSSKETGDLEDNGAAGDSPPEAPKVSGDSSETNLNSCSGGCVSYRTADYPEMMSELVIHESSRVPSDDLAFCVMAFALLQISKQTGWLSTETRRIQSADPNPPLDNRLDLDMEKAVFAALLHHIQMIQCNGFEITEMRQAEGQTGNVLQRHKIHGLGLGLYPDVATINHSCDPTVDLVFYGNQATIRAIRNIQAPEEVTIDYGRLFFIHDKSIRQRFLRSTYFFDCRCPPCLDNWPLWKDLPSSEPPIKCPGCGVRLKSVSAKGCSKCRRVFGDELTKAVIRLDDSQSRYAVAMRGMDSAKSPEADESEMKQRVAVVEDYLSTMQELLYLPWRDFYSCQATLRQFYRIMANISSQSASA